MLTRIDRNTRIDAAHGSGLIDLTQLNEMRLFRRQYDAVTAEYPELGERRLVHEVIRRMINHIVVDLVRTSQERIENAQPASIDEVRLQPRPLIALSEATLEEHRELMHFLRERVYRHYKVLRMTTKARRVIEALFGAFLANTELMPPEHHELAVRSEAAHGTEGRARAVADYIAGMTDRYAILEHERLFDPAERT